MRSFTAGHSRSSGSVPDGLESGTNRLLGDILQSVVSLPVSRIVLVERSRDMPGARPLALTSGAGARSRPRRPIPSVMLLDEELDGWEEMSEDERQRLRALLRDLGLEETEDPDEFE